MKKKQGTGKKRGKRNEGGGTGLSGNAVSKWFLAAVLLAGVIGLRTLANDLVWDDRDKILSVPPINEIPLSGFFTTNYWEGISHEPQETGYYRPVVTLSFAIDNFLWGGGPDPSRVWPYRLQNIILRIATVCLLCVLLSNLFQGRLFAGIAAALFAVHPLLVEPVAFLSARTDLLQGFLTLAAILLAFPKEDRRSVSREACSCICFILALLSKESAISTPVLLLITAYFQESGIRKIQRVFLIQIGIACGYLLLRIAIVGSAIPLPEEAEGATVGFLLAGKTFLYYFRALFLPVHLSGDYGFPVREVAILRAEGGTGLLLITGLLVLAWIMRKKSPVLTGGILWLIISFIPVSGIIPIPQFQADRYMYIPMIGWAIPAALGLEYVSGLKTGGWSDAIRSVPVVVVALLAVISMVRMEVWEDEYSFWNDVVKKNPKNARGLFNRAVELERIADGMKPGESREKIYITVMMDYQKAIILYPAAWKARRALAELLAKKGKIDESLEIYREAVKASPDVPEIQHNMGIALARTGSYDEAVKAFRKSIFLRENYPLALYNLGKTCRELELWVEAEESLKKCLNLEPSNLQAAFMLGELYAGPLKKPGDAAQLFERVLKGGPPPSIRDRILTLLSSMES